MDNREILEELKTLHKEVKDTQYKIMSLMEKLENEEIIKAKGYYKRQKQIIINYIANNGKQLNKNQQQELHNKLKEVNINKLSLLKMFKELKIKYSYKDNSQFESWKDVIIEHIEDDK